MRSSRPCVDAVILVAIVVLLFLQDWKAVMLPLIDVGVSLVGTFAVMKLMGFTLNNLTLFGLVLAIGIVVDDAIVVLENIERWLAKGLSIRDATIKAMDEITGPIIAITLVLSAVFLPSAFLGGITGQFYRQFALTIAASMIISAVNAMTHDAGPGRRHLRRPQARRSHGHDDGREALPWWFFGLLGGAGVALAAVAVGRRRARPGRRRREHARRPRQPEGRWLRPAALYAAALRPRRRPSAALLGWLIIRPVNWLLGGSSAASTGSSTRATRFYGDVVGWSLRLSAVVLLLYVGLLGLTYFGFTMIPERLHPQPGQGLPHRQRPAARLGLAGADGRGDGPHPEDRRGDARRRAHGGHSRPVVRHERRQLQLRHACSSSSSRSTNAARRSCIRRRSRNKLRTRFMHGDRAGPAAGLRGAGRGRPRQRRRLQADAGRNRRRRPQGRWRRRRTTSAKRAARQPGFIGLFSSFRAATPQLYVDVDRVKCKTMKVDLNDVFDTLQVFLGGYYVNDFNRFGRTWQVNIQADAPYRINAETVKQFKVRNADGDMVPLGAVATVRDEVGPVFVLRYNMYTATAINGAALPSVSSGTVIDTMEQLAKRELPRNMTYEWTELTYMQKEATRTESLRDLLQNPFMAFVGAVVLVFLVLAALYESWSLPLSVILVVPMCLLCAMAGVFLAAMDLNIFVQVGFVVLVGLASKNAILIVEFARDRQKEGQSLFAATVEAARVRLRPIIMTSFAFILGVVPLVVAGGAGAEMRRTLGTAVFSGMLGVTLFGIFLTPVFFYVVRGLLGGARPCPHGRPSITRRGPII